QVTDGNDISNEHNDMCGIELPDSLKKPCSAGCEALLEHRTPIHHRCSVAGNEYEKVGGVAEPEISHCDPANCVARDVVEKNGPIWEATEQVEPKIAPAIRECDVSVHSVQLYPEWLGKQMSTADLPCNRSLRPLVVRCCILLSQPISNGSQAIIALKITRAFI